MCGATEGGLSLDGVNVAKEAVIQGQVLRGDEPVPNAYVRLLDRTRAQDLALDHGLLGDVDAVERQAALLGPAHQALRSSAWPGSSPRATGTPTREPYSVHEPS